MLTILLAALSALFLFLFVYPYLIYPVLLARLPERPVARAQGDVGVSILFCAFNEARSLPEKISNLRALKARHPALEVLAYDDGSTDGTTGILEEAGEILTLVRGAGRTGKACGMKQLARLARGDVLVFTDANVILAEDALDNLMPYYGDPEVGGVCGTLKYASAEGSTTAEVGSLYWRLDEKLRSLESRSGNVMGADGSIFSIRSVLYPEFPDSVLDDFTVSMGVVFQGRRLVRAPDVVAFENSVSDRGEELRRKVRIGARSYHTHLHLRPQLRAMSVLDRFKYTSRKMLRWFGGFSLASSVFLALVAFATVSAPLALGAASLAAVMLVALASVKRGALAKAGDAIFAIFATQLGIWKGMRGQSVTTWTPAKSR